MSNLPEAYTSIWPYMETESRKDYFVSVGCTANKPQSDVVTENMKCEYQWLNKVNKLLEKEKLEGKEYLLSLVHLATLQTTALSPTAITSLLPPFEENAHSIKSNDPTVHDISKGRDRIQQSQTDTFTLSQNRCNGREQMSMGRVAML